MDANAGRLGRGINRRGENINNIKYPYCILRMVYWNTVCSSDIKIYKTGSKGPILASLTPARDNNSII